MVTPSTPSYWRTCCNPRHNSMLETSEAMITIIFYHKITRTIPWPDPNPGFRHSAVDLGQHTAWIQNLPKLEAKFSASDIFTAVFVVIVDLGVMTPCSSVSGCWSFGKTCCLRLHIIMILVIWVVTPPSLLCIFRRFGGSYFHHLQGWRCKHNIPPKSRYPLTRSYGITAQKTTVLRLSRLLKLKLW
jgi:hypothetical protein